MSKWSYRTGSLVVSGSPIRRDIELPSARHSQSRQAGAFSRLLDLPEGPGDNPRL